MCWRSGAGPASVQDLQSRIARHIGASEIGGLAHTRALGDLPWLELRKAGRTRKLARRLRPRLGIGRWRAATASVRATRCEVPSCSAGSTQDFDRPFAKSRYPA